MNLPSFVATARATSFSLKDDPWHPGSFPPCPASITMVRKPEPGFCAEQNMEASVSASNEQMHCIFLTMHINNSQGPSLKYCSFVNDQPTIKVSESP